ncbi:hypothetical protein DUNSADRAFT_15413 [Dunaliella salina]|uniref:Encoded protein n=1 Tax=Dunaliella salina TaxID=3046 RepID=A0ABQ7G5H1_DUNSA|nr:hypothetical protein DUNSADRAFT_15413 [Dunaliella salina]|eukprot:KAF5829849.1 hypothetical protein DUNSADRAFT_15413 [Dunaliella salina]
MGGTGRKTKKAMSKRSEAGVANARVGAGAGAEKVEASSGPIYQALKEKATTGGQPPAYVLIPAQAPPAYYHPPAAPAYYHPPAPRAMAAANAPTSRTVTGSGGISVVTSTPVSVSNPITIDSPSSSISGGFGFGLFG